MYNVYVEIFKKRGVVRALRRFSAYTKKIARRYNFRIFLVNILPLCLVLTLIFISYFMESSVMPPKYYSFFFTILTICLGFSLITVTIGSYIATTKLNGHKKHTFIEIKGKFLVISEYRETSFLSPHEDDYKDLFVIRLDEIEDIYLFGKKIIIIAPTRVISQRADFLDYSVENGDFILGGSWDLSCAGELREGIEIPDFFRRPMGIAKAIENCREKLLEKQRKRDAFREHLLSVANSDQFRKARKFIKRGSVGGAYRHYKG